MSTQTAIIRKTRGQWSSEPAFVFSMAAAAVGLGNLWRFPYMVGEGGGAAFIFAYILALIIVAVPIMVLEVAMGRISEGNTVHTFRHVHKSGTILGWFVVTITAIITSYYLVITGWTLGYLVDASRQQLVPFADFVTGYNSLYYFFAIIILTSAILFKGLRALEFTSKALMPLLLAVVVFLAITASYMPGWEKAKAFMLQVDFSKLKYTNIWVMAFGQTFYSLAIGQGYLVTYGSYIPEKTNLPRACLIVVTVETLIALLAGWLIFPFVFSYGVAPDKGSQLAFTVLPRIFNDMQWGLPVAILFFMLFFLAAFSSSLAGLKVIISTIAEEFHLSNRKAVLTVAFLMTVLGLPSALSFSPLKLMVGNMPFIDWVDRLVGTKVVLFSGVIGAAYFTWLVPPICVAKVLGAKSRWWGWRMYIIGRWLPLFILGWLLVTYFLL